MEVRYAKVYRDGEVIREEPYEVSDKEIAEEKVTDDILNRADTLIDKDPKAFLKKLTARLIKKGILP